MNSLLAKHRPKDQPQDRFEELWENLAVSLEPLYKAIKELTPKEKLTPDDLTNPNMYGKMVWVQAQKDLSEKILDLFPKGLDKLN